MVQKLNQFACEFLNLDKDQFNEQNQKLLGDPEVLVKIKNSEMMAQIKNECPEITALTREEAIKIYKFYKKNEWEMVESSKMIEKSEY